MSNLPTIEDIEEAAIRINGVAKNTPLQLSKRLSDKFKATIYLKREDLQKVRSYKIRGAYNLMKSLTDQQKEKGVVCASAGNHAQGVAYSASALGIKATIFMSVKTPLQKINRVKQFGEKWVEIKLVGNTFDESYQAAQEYSKQTDTVYVSGFDNDLTIAGQGTIGKELYDELGESIDYVICPIGGGGLISGISIYIKEKIKKSKVIGAEPVGAASMKRSVEAGKITPLEKIDNFVDGAAVGTVGVRNFEITKKYVDDIIVVPEGQVATTMIELYQNEGIVAEPAGALSIACLEMMGNQLKGKTVVCILSGGNNDILRYPDIIERSLVYQGRKHYFVIEFAQKPEQLKQFVNKALGSTDDIVRFEYIKKNSKETGPTLVGIEQASKEDYDKLIKRMGKIGINYKVLENTDLLYSYLI